jgi:hypothetical protein
MKIALAQANDATGDIKFNLQTLHKHVLRASESHADAIFFGEAFLQGFDALNFDFGHDQTLAKSLDCPELYFIARLAHDRGIAIGLGFYRLDGEAIHSSYIVFDKNGSRVALYDRISSGWKIAKASSHYVNGSELVSFSLEGKTFGLGLCGDGFTPTFLTHVESCHFPYFVWPVYVNFTEGEWQKNYSDYALNASRLGGETLMVGSLSDRPKAVGATLVFKDKKILCSIPLGQESLLIKTL